MFTIIKMIFLIRDISKIQLMK